MSEPIDEIYDQRQHRRVPATGSARVNFGGQWHSYPLLDLSGGGARFSAKLRPLIGTNVLVQLRGLGMVRAKVIKRGTADFAVVFNQEDFCSGDFVDNLMLYANAELMAPNAAKAPGVNAPGAEPAPQGEAAAEISEIASETSRKSRNPLRLDKWIGRKSKSA